jgi:hypothetical protein
MPPSLEGIRKLIEIDTFHSLRSISKSLCSLKQQFKLLSSQQFFRSEKVAPMTRYETLANAMAAEYVPLGSGLPVADALPSVLARKVAPPRDTAD